MYNAGAPACDPSLPLPAWCVTFWYTHHAWKGTDVQIRIPRRHIALFVGVKKRIAAQIRARGVEPSDSAIFAEMVVILDGAVQPTPLPGTATPDAFLAAITRALDLGAKAMDAADRLDAMFRTQFPDEYAASAADKEDAA